MNKKILITGITGMVGSHLADFILKNKKNWKIYGCCRWRSDVFNINHLFQENTYNKKVFLRYMDLTDLSSVQEVVNEVKPDIVFHLAAQSFPKASFNMRSLTFETNIIGTDNLLHSLKELKNQPIIHVCSSSEVFGRVSKKELPIDENCRFHPASPYAISKIGTDLIANFYFESYKMKILTTRMFTHTGPRRGDYFMESTFAKQIAMIEADYQKPIVYVGNLNTLRTISDVRDAVRAYCLLVTKKPKFGETYNIGGSYTTTAKQILNFLMKQSSVKKIKIKIDKNRLRPIDADLQIPNSNKFKKHTKWKPEIKFEQTMIDLLNYWRERIKKNGPIINR
jgi:GDPmannose 4,6-dehydratase